MPGGQRLIDHIVHGRFWVNDNQQDLTGRPLTLKASTLGSLIKKQMAKVAITVPFIWTATQLPER